MCAFMCPNLCPWISHQRMASKEHMWTRTWEPLNKVGGWKLSGFDGP